jgi:GNAT superfamily N-acetyltransferase
MAPSLPHLSGWRSLRKARIDFYQCPNCGHCWDLVSWGPDRLAQCCHCKRQFPPEKFGKKALLRIVAVCDERGSDVQLIPGNESAHGYVCANCSNYVAILHGTHHVHPKTVLDPRWLTATAERGAPIDERLWVLDCKSKSDFLVLHMLQMAAQQEDGRFQWAYAKENRALLCSDASKRKYVGYLVWYRGERARLNQIFIVPAERRKGYAARLVEYWVKAYADRISQTCEIESPHAHSIDMLVKLGYGHRKEGKVVGDKCLVFRGM